MVNIRDGRKIHIGYAGELLVASLLSQYELNLSPVGGTAEVCDILVSSPKTNELRRIEVKTRSYANSKVIDEEAKTKENNKGWMIKNPIYTDQQLIYAFVDYKNNRKKPNSQVDIWFVPSLELDSTKPSCKPTDVYPDRIVVNYNRLNTKERMKKFYYSFDKVFPGIKYDKMTKNDESTKSRDTSYNVIQRFILNTNETKKDEDLFQKKKRLKGDFDDAKAKWKKYGKWE